MTAIVLAAKLIAVIEGCKLKAYQDGKKVWTIGYGHTKGVHEGMVIDKPQADAWLLEDIAPIAEMVKDKPMIAAVGYISFGFNVGPSPVRKVLAGTSKMSEYININGEKSDALVRRRELETALVASAQPEAE